MNRKIGQNTEREGNGEWYCGSQTKVESSEVFSCLHILQALVHKSLTTHQDSLIVYKQKVHLCRLLLDALPADLGKSGKFYENECLTQ